ncbi:MAG TPA: prolipoprotein diacylglyceryl transferase [Ohtaekwangia sp.]
MGILSYVIWNGSPEIFSMGSFSLRWYGLFFALGFLISQQILYYIYRREGKPEKDVDTLTIYMVIATILGARLGHVLFYQREIIWEDPFAILLPFEFSPFRFTGLQGLASHGAAIGILFALWLYSRKKKPGQNYLQVVDRIVILVALTGALIRLGNYFNAEIIGKPTEKPWGVVFTGRLTELASDERTDKDGILEDIVYIKNDSLERKEDGRVPLLIYFFFKPGATEEQIDFYLNRQVRPLLLNRLVEFFDDSHHLRMDFATAKPEGGGFVAKVKTYGVARHPAQLYEAIACIILFVLLLLIWLKYKEKLPAGRLLGIFLIWCFGLRFVFEFLKENQADFESGLPLNMGQILSIPLFIAGILILILSYRQKDT